MTTILQCKVLNRVPVLLAMLLCIALCSCEPAIDRAEVVGEYSLELPTGEIEVWRLGPDGLFTQKLYRDKASITNQAPPLHVFESRWSIKGGHLWMDKTKEFFSLFPPFEVLRPDAQNAAKWASPMPWARGGFGLETPLIMISDDQGIFYVKSPGNQLTPRMVGWPDK